MATENRTKPGAAQRSTIWRQTWRDVAFLHWSVPSLRLNRLIPRGLILDTYEAAAWVGIIPFWISRFGHRRGPRIPSRIPEINVRTYVTDGKKPGVWFFSLDTTSNIAVWGARLLYHLPYRHARMEVSQSNGPIAYRSEVHQGTFRARYGPVGDVARAEPGSLEHWLTERYALYAIGRGGSLYRAEIRHVPWPLQRAEALIEQNDLPRSVGLPDLPASPALAHFASELDVSIGPARRLV